jgi:hypothetical protein
MPGTAQLLAELEAFPQRLEECFSLFSPVAQHWRPESWNGIPSERLTALEQVCHVRDIERDGYHVRIRRTLEERTPVLPDIPGESLAVERRYFAAQPAEVLSDFRAARAETVALVRGLSEAQLQRIAIFESNPLTLRNLLHFLCSHDNQHLAGLHWLLAKLPGS